MHENGIVAEVGERLQQAGLMPPVSSLEWQGDEDAADDKQPWVNPSESVLIGVVGPISAELEARLSDVLHGLRYEVQSVPIGYHVDYRRDDSPPTE